MKTASQGDTDGPPRVDAATEASGGANCGKTPTKLVDYVLDVPDAGRMAVQVPRLAVNATDVFYILNWSQPIESGGAQAGALMRVPKQGGKAVKLASIPGGNDGNQPLGATPDAVVFGQGPTGDAGQGAIISVPAQGGDPAILATTVGLARTLIADRQNVYFVDEEATHAAPLAGGPTRTLATETPFSLGIAGRTLYLADYGEKGTLSSVSVDGGSVTVLAADAGGVLYPTACGDDLCWVSGPALSATLKRLAPGGSPVVVADGFTEPLGLVFDGNNFFVTVGGGGLYLLRISANGGAPIMVTVPGALISGLAMDDSCLYWSGASGIFSLARSAADTAEGPTTL